ncbi:protein GLE1-like isoform X2 [Cynara cardunculus var. scolymus]|uniref:protein GLE1-like isoform X2 n=1 Tax=Cynara cardunculus var. scolymus TaxID=59895 RepID=UPI000D62CC91|nr:protein GLE1-like isoform X2 [Cynara cardunculus var. scolymus]XP_024991628.1 protein GLE1-like isoform X2 [Cynara cardunculus var. scolymus]XP_024991630.1 protein GLE1-like isoform X2 [Cynara cardunculus var. scolymus]
MGGVKLELRCPQRVGGIVADPQIDWSFDELLSELNAVDHRLQASSLVSLPFTKTHSSDLSVVSHAGKNRKSFVMHVSDDEGDYDDEGNYSRPLAMGGRFACEEVYLSDDADSDNESTTGAQWSLMDKGGVIEGALIELSHEHQITVAEDIRTRISAFGTDLTNEKEKLTNALSRAEKSKEARRELDRKRDLQYQRIIAEALDNHLTDVQRHHEYKSQIEEKKIRDDAAIEEAKRKQKALQEEKVRQEKMKAEEAKRQAEKKRDEEAKAAALEAERAAKEAAVAESQRKAAEAMTASQGAVSKGSDSGGPKKTPAGNILKGAESALKMEERRLQMYKEVVGKDVASEMDYNKEYRSHGMQMARRIKTITGTKENVRTKADELVKLMNSTCPQSVNIGIFAEKVVSQSTNASSNNVLYGYGHVIVMVTSQVPHAMEILLAKLNRVCIFTVPKYLSYSEAAFESKDAYFKAIGYQEEDGNLESTDSYIARLTLHMKLYGALVQTEVDGFQNLHGIEEGWKWLARFLNALPANIYTAVALQAFVELAGFGLYRRYKNQFKKLLNIISRDFLKALKEREDPKVTKVVMSLENYIQTNEFQKEPEGWRLQDSLLSHGFVPNESDHQQQYHNNSSGYRGGYQQQQYNYNSSYSYRYQR